MANYFCTDSVEEQVDYLTDKVKDLKTTKLDKAAVVQATGTGIDVVMSQKAVTDTINENLQTVNESLQTVNTEVNGKLTKPSNPSAESAVTMLADGTVGTKLLSEIGGSGGGSSKMYKHIITFTNISTIPPGYNYGRMTIISADSNSYTSPTELAGIATGFTATVGSSNDNTMYTFVVLNSYVSNGTELALEGVKGTANSAMLIDAITDTYIEL